MNTKKNVLIIGSIGTLLVLTLFSLETNSCYISPFCLKIRGFFSNDMFVLVFLTPPLFLLSLITFRMKDEVFRAWWGFARWWVPVIIVVTLLLENAGGGGTLGMNKDFTAFILIILYSVFGIVSLVKIARTYLKTKRVIIGKV